MAEITLARAEKAINLKYQLWKSQIFEWEEKQVCQKRLREIKIGKKRLYLRWTDFQLTITGCLQRIACLGY